MKRNTNNLREMKLNGPTFVLGFLREDGQLFRRPLDHRDLYPQQSESSWASRDFSRELDAIYSLCRAGKRDFSVLTDPQETRNPDEHRARALARQARFFAASPFLEQAVQGFHENEHDVIQVCWTQHGSADGILDACNTLCIIADKSVKLRMTTSTDLAVQSIKVQATNHTDLQHDLSRLLNHAGFGGHRYRLYSSPASSRYSNAEVSGPHRDFSPRGESAREILAATIRLKKLCAAIGFQYDSLRTPAQRRKLA